MRFRSVFLYEYDLLGYLPKDRYFEYRLFSRTIGMYHVLLRAICRKEISRFKRYSINEEEQFLIVSIQLLVFNIGYVSRCC